MSFRARGGYSQNQGRQQFRGGKSGFRGNYRNDNSNFSQGPPAELKEVGEFMHSCEGDMVCKAIISQVPYFNAPIYLENKALIGKVDEILGPMNEFYFTVKPEQGIVASSMTPRQRVMISTDKLLPLERFLPKPKSQPTKKSSRGSRGGMGGRGGRGHGIGRGGSFNRGRGRFPQTQRR